MASSTAIAPKAGVGPLLREWRRRRRRSQLELALDAGVSARHISFLETGRSNPSREMVIGLAANLELPLRDRNELLVAAGYAPEYRELAYEDPDLGPIRAAIDQVLAAHDPYPALVVDRHWELVTANRGMGLLTAGAAPHLLEPPANALRLALHPEGLAPRTLNLGEWRHHILERLERHWRLTGDPALRSLLEELRGYPGEEVDEAAAAAAHDVFVPFRLRGPEGGELAFFGTIATFGTALDVTVAELSLESFFPADD
ncbi:MAG: helix-turn-helix transcriptional regulator, partial [Actinobacteria bacterium]|nr:helix-turn-helix transcriptional regulator [Actinomycetota bacterium]